jgi:hypothetical protein
MTPHRSWHWLLACSVATVTGTAGAAPEECLTLRDNFAVAGCADKYAPKESTRPGRPGLQPAKSASQTLAIAEQSLLFPVPSAALRAAPAPREPPDVIAERDRSELVQRSEVGAATLAAMGLAFGLWRWRASAIKTVPPAEPAS